MTRRSGSEGILVEFQPMSPEEMHRTMQFVLRQQAQFAADFERLSPKMDRMADAIIGLTGIVGHLHTAQLRTDEQLRRTNETVHGVGEYIKTVESHLNVLIEMYEQHLRDDHGHRPS